MTNFDSSLCPDIPRSFDVIVVGAGAAGLYTALSLPDNYKVGLINKENLAISASDWAQGGIAAAIDPDDSPKFHFEDTLAAGAGLCEPEAVDFLVKQAPSCIKSLVNLGVGFDRHGKNLSLTLEAAHSHRRVLHAADTTGRAVITTLTAQVLSRSNISILSPAFALNLWLDPHTQNCQGISLFYQGQISWLRASTVILATGGGGQVFSQTTNPEVSTGDGVAMAWRAGALLRDLEFFQFHPTALTKAGAPHFLISEAVRGEGAHLVDAQGYRFAFEYHPAGELAPRDVVSRAIFSYLQHTDNNQVFLDLGSIPAEVVRRRFPNIIQVCQQWGIDVFSQPVPVAPAAHYWMGGIVTDKMNCTSIPGLYAVGETASTGVHGANRLASNSLLECLVFGAQMSRLDIPNVASEGQSPDVYESVKMLYLMGINPEEECIIKKIRTELPDLLWQYAGISRYQEGLEEAIATLEVWRDQFIGLDISKSILNLQPQQIISCGNGAESLDYLDLRRWGETYNLLDVGYLILRTSLYRSESRGGHYRRDYPKSDSNWKAHTLVKESNLWKSDFVCE